MESHNLYEFKGEIKLNDSSEIYDFFATYNYSQF